MNIFGKNVMLSVSGDKSGPVLLVTLDGLPSGVNLNIEDAWKAMETIGDQQEETPAVISGLREGVTDGSPLTAMLRMREETPRLMNAPRPGHEDMAAMASAKGADFSAGAYSGRINCAIAFAGAICAQLLTQKGIEINGRVISIGGIRGTEQDFDLKKALLDARGSGDSIGSQLECIATGLPAGLGSPLFEGVESRIAALLFSIPGVKGVEFGLGFGFASMRGSEANDPIVLREGHITTETNHSGGADVGITTGLPLIVRMAMRPAPAIGREQRTVDMNLMEETTLRLRGRHEPCLGPRAVPVMEGALALCLLDTVMDQMEKKE